MTQRLSNEYFISHNTYKINFFSSWSYQILNATNTFSFLQLRYVKKLLNAIIFVQVLCHSTHKPRMLLIYKSEYSQLDEF